MNEREQKEFEKLQNENQALRDLLSRMTEGPYFIGKIAAGPDKETGSYRVDCNGNTTITPLHPDLVNTLKDKKLKVGTTVVQTKDCIIRILPEELEEQVKPVVFNFVKWEEIGGIKSQLARIRETIDGPIHHKQLYKQFGRKPSKGILLYGPPGCGKTMVAKAIASQLLAGQQLTEDSFIYLKGGEMLSPYVGVAEKSIQSIFERARRNFAKHGLRSVIFIDEAEAILPTRGSRKSSDVETTIVPTFISEMDGFEDSGSFIILATNHKDQLDPAVIRPGRIDLQVFIGRPTVEDATEIFSIYLKNTIVEGRIEDVAKKAARHLYTTPLSDEVSGALIANVVQDGISLAIKESIQEGKTIPVNAAHLMAAIGFVKPI